MKHKQYKTGSISRQARRVRPHAKRDQARQAHKQVVAGQTKCEIQGALQAKGYLVHAFWQHLWLGELLHQAGVKQKFEGLSAVSLTLIALMFGFFNANSVSDLAEQAQADLVVLELCVAQGLERKQLYRFLGKISDETYLAWLGEIVRER